MKKILMASSSNQFLKRNSDLLMGRGLELFITNSGQEALRLHKEFHYDLILSDALLEDMDGKTLCGLVNQDKELRHLPIILCCRDGHESVAKFNQSKVVAFLVKPINPTELLETVSRLFDMQIGRSKRVAFKVKVLSKSLGLEFICQSHDLSSSGILVETDKKLAIGDQVFCQFKLPSSCQIETDGEVIRSVNTIDCKIFYGIKFINIPLPYINAIEEYVNLKSNPFISTKRHIN